MNSTTTNTWLVAVLVGLLSVCGGATDVAVTAAAKVNLGPGETLRSSTVSAKALPPALSDKVLYHFDASNVEGWEFADAARTQVKKIPSDYGTRYLTSAPESSWKPANWGADYPFESPTYVTSVAALGGKPAVDFGAIGSGCAMVFNPDAANENKNLVSNVGTVIAVWGSENGGGWLLSGGEGSRNTLGADVIADYLGHRSTVDPETGVTAETYTWRNPLWIDPGWYAVRDAWVYHDGQPGAAPYVGFNGGWEVLSVVMNTSRCQFPNTAGIGINDARSGSYFKTKRSGGMGVAEIYYFSEQLSDADRRAVEAYLQAKWFNRAMPGHNGNAEVGLVRVNKTEPNDTPAWGVEAAVEVAAGDTLTVDELAGGRRGGTLTKSGAGKLALGKSSGYGGTLRVAEGGVAFARRATPLALPANPWFRLDASDMDSLETTSAGGVTYVTKWSNKARFPIAGNAAETLCVVSPSDVARPVLLADALGSGKNVLDFGILFSGRRLEAKGGAGLANLKIPGVTAAFMVMAPTFSGGSVFGDPYTAGTRSFLDRGADDAAFTRGILGYTLPLWLTKTFHDNNLSYAFDGNSGTTRSNGRLIDPDKGFFSCGWQVLGVTTPGAEVSSIGGGRVNCTYSGGFRVAEIVLYNRPLTDLEVRDAEAYLTEKWLGKSALGYASAAPKTPELLNLALADGAEVSVPAGAAARIGTLTTDGMFVKTGGGALEVETPPASIDLRVDGGTVRTVAKSDPPAFDKPAVNPAFHLDATESGSLVFYPDACGTTNYVMQWHDARGSGNVAFCPQPDYAKYAPYVDSTRRQNGHPVIDFGVNDTEYRRLHFNRSQDAIRSVYVVWGTRGKALTAGVLLGSANSATDIDDGHKNGSYDFLRNSADLFGYWYYTEPVCTTAKIFVNGEATTRTYHPVEGFQLVEVHTYTGVHASALNDDRQGSAPTGATYAGGMSYGEILVYERELTEREKVATRNYLMKKWFGKTDAELTPLPGSAPTAPALNVNGLYAGPDSQFDGSITPADLRGTAGSKATVVDDMTVGDVNVYTGVLSVASGATLSVTSGGALVRGDAPGIVSDGCIMHLDASQGVETDANGVVTKWNNLAGGDLHAIPSGKPQLRKDGLFDGRPYVYMYGYSWQGGGGDVASRRNCFYFADKDGQTNKLTNIRSAFWVLNSKDGGGILLSGGEQLVHNSWYRGKTKKSTADWHGMVYADAPILQSGGYAAGASWWLNAAEVDPLTTGLSGGNDLISVNFRPEDPSGSAWGFAFNGWYHNPNDGTVETCGWQYLAELVIYDRELTVVERTEVEAYLSQKWGLGVYKRTNGASADLVLQSGSKLDLAGNSCGLGVLSGSGTVDNADELRVTGLDVGTAGGGAAQMSVYGDLTIADGGVWKVTAGDGPLAVCGRLSFEGAVTFDLSELDVEVEATDGVVCLASATSFGTLPARDLVSAVGAKHPVRLFVRDGRLYLRVEPKGFLIKIR